MNLLLSDDYLLQDYPETMTDTIRSGHTLMLRFDRTGDYLAAGRGDGVVVVWDMETMGVARKLRGHQRNISSLSWSKCGRYLLSTCAGWKAILWDLQDGSRFRELRFKASLFQGDLHPRNHLRMIASLWEEQLTLVDMTDPIGTYYTLPSAPKRPFTDDATELEKRAKQDAKELTTAAIWTANGDHILAGTIKGWLNIIDADSLEIIYSEKICGAAIVSLRLTGTGRDLLVNSQDRIIRTFKIPDLSSETLDLDTLQVPLEHKFQDVVQRLSWNSTTFSATGEYVAASTYNNHELYVWERVQKGSLQCILKEPKEEQGVIEWHPSKALLASCGIETGRIFIWSVINPQKWSALAPDFAEVEENVEYIEKEDEFDIYGQEEIHRRRLDAEDEDVDVLTPAPGTKALDGSGFQMPILFNLGESDSEEELIKLSAGTMRRRSFGEGQDDLEDGGAERAVGKKGAPGKGGRARKK